MSFVENVRKNLVSSPVHRSFSLLKWRDAYELGRVDDTCLKLYESGVIIYKILCSIRQQHSSLVRFENSEKHIRLLIGLVNRDSLLLRDLVQERLSQENEIFFPNSLTQYKFTLSGGGEHGIEEVSQANGDSLSSAVKSALKSPVTKKSRLSSYEHLETLKDDLNLCGTYAVIESIWAECQWNEYGIHQDGENSYSIYPVSEVGEEYARIKAVTEYRKSMLQMHTGMLIASAWKNELSDGQKHALMPIRFLEKIRKEGKKWKFFLGSFEDSVATPSAVVAFISKDLIATGYYTGLLAEKPKELGGASIEQLFDVWLVIRSLAHAGSQRYSPIDIYNPNTLLSMSHVFTRVGLTRLLVEATKLPFANIQSILDFLTFTGERSETLWTQPLLALSDSNITFSIVSTHTAHPTYVFERWLPQLSVQISKKGSPFEEVVRRELMNCDKAEYLEEHLKVLPAGLALKTGRKDHRNEEIDLVFLFGDIVVIGEIKCSVTPIEPIDYYNNRKILAGAQEQVVRKSRAIRDNEAAFRKSLIQYGISLPAMFKTVELIVVNNAYYVGYPFSGVPVVDCKILTKYFEGEFIQLGESINGGEVRSKKNVIFHSSFEEAKNKFSDYLVDPPQLSLYKESIESRKTIIPLRSLEDSLPDLDFYTPEISVQLASFENELGTETSKNVSIP